ncbi:hypothetical protein [Azospirillum sp. INR13]|uniref:hypothetical protein n=1 Tax=Azospirillum sp. INR13 TaxID=2596919 RepID=UPI002108383D|nr:hypothetical protein [Azospirillum sp. INR13]
MEARELKTFSLLVSFTSVPMPVAKGAAFSADLLTVCSYSWTLPVAPPPFAPPLPAACCCTRLTAASIDCCRLWAMLPTSVKLDRLTMACSPSFRIPRRDVDQGFAGCRPAARY